MAENQQTQPTETNKPNEIRVGGNKRTEAYVKIAEGLLTQHEEIEIGGLGNSTCFATYNNISQSSKMF